MADNRRKYFRELGNTALVSFVNEFFDLALQGSSVVPLEGLDPKAEFFWSDIFVVDGKYLVKEILNPTMNNDTGYMVAKQAVLEHMRLAGVPVVLPEMSTAGTPFSTIRTRGEDESHLVEVMPYISGTERFSAQRFQVAELGDVVGRITFAFTRLSPDVEKVIAARGNIFQRYNSPEGRTFDEELDFYDKKAGTLTGWLGEEVRAILGPARKEYERIKASPAFPSPEYDIPKGIVHGDIHDFNTLFYAHTGHFAKVLDWDSMSRKVRVQDLALSMERFSRVLPDYHVSYPDRAELFYKEFSKYYDCSPVEEAHMFDALMDYYLPNVCGILRDVFYNGVTNKNYPIYLAVLNPKRIRTLETELFGHEA